MPEASPTLIDGVIAFATIEFVTLAVLLAKSGKTRWIAPLAMFLGSGGFLLIALRLAIEPGASRAVAPALLFSFVAHVGLLIWAGRAVVFRDAGRAGGRPSAED